MANCQLTIERWQLTIDIMKIALISPYHGGSHKAWADGFAQHSTHDVQPLTLPDRFWKWRMHGGGVTLARQFLDTSWQPDLILATDMLDLSSFMALTRSRTAHLPAVLYMHENQLTYPLPTDSTTGPMRRQLGERDQHYAFINYVSMLTANQVLFNSNYHQRSFFDALPNLLKHFPEYNELESIPELKEKSAVLPVGVDFDRLAIQSNPQPSSSTTPLIVWNQRWEYDKNPELFFEILFQIADEGVPFRLALCGQEYGKRPLLFTQAIEQLSSQIIHVGHADLNQYRQLLWQAEVTISTAHHEFFGISILEAIYCHTFPILPHRLSYPALLPSSFHKHCLYKEKDALLQRVRWALTEREQARKIAAELATAVTPYAWQTIAQLYDHLLTQLVRHNKQFKV